MWLAIPLQFNFRLQIIAALNRQSSFGDAGQDRAGEDQLSDSISRSLPLAA